MRSMTLRKAKQKGFTLLELLVVITLLAILATGALLAYEGLTETAQAASGANSAAVADQSIRNYRAVTGDLPNQWDHLVTDDGVPGTTVAAQPLDFVADETYRFLATVNVADVSTAGAIRDAFLRVNVDEYQVRTIPGVTAGVEPNLLHNEGAVRLATNNPTNTETVELGLDTGGFFDRLVVVPTARTTDDGATFNLCAVGAAAATPVAIRDAATVATRNAPLVGTPANAANFLNRINDAFEPDECHLIAAFGFGNDAAKSTAGSAAAIAAAPTYSSTAINPAQNYARYIALFHLGSADDNVIPAASIFQKPRLVGIVDGEGRIIDQNIATANAATQQ